MRPQESSRFQEAEPNHGSVAQSGAICAQYIAKNAGFTQPLHCVESAIDRSLGGHEFRTFSNDRCLKFGGVNIGIPIENVGVPWWRDVIHNRQSLFKNELCLDPDVSSNRFTSDTCHVFGAVRDAFGVSHPTDHKNRSTTITGGSEGPMLYRVVGPKI